MPSNTVANRSNNFTVSFDVISEVVIAIKPFEKIANVFTIRVKDFLFLSEPIRSDPIPSKYSFHLTRSSPEISTINDLSFAFQALYTLFHCIGSSMFTEKFWLDSLPPHFVIQTSNMLPSSLIVPTKKRFGTIPNSTNC